MKEDFLKIYKKACESGEKLLDKIISRKLIVWLVATHMAYIELLDSDNWLMISLLYMGALSALDYKYSNSIAQVGKPSSLNNNNTNHLYNDRNSYYDTQTEEQPSYLVRPVQ